MWQKRFYSSVCVYFQEWAHLALSSFPMHPQLRLFALQLFLDFHAIFLPRIGPDFFWSSRFTKCSGRASGRAMHKVHGQPTDRVGWAIIPSGRPDLGLCWVLSRWIISQSAEASSVNGKTQHFLDFRRILRRQRWHAKFECAQQFAAWRLEREPWLSLQIRATFPVSMPSTLSWTTRQLLCASILRLIRTPPS